MVISLTLFSGTLQAQSPASFRVLLGVTDTTSTRWDGTAHCKGRREIRN